MKKNIKPTEITRTWYYVDADGKTLGRLATRIAQVLQGKHRPYYSPQWDMGDHVVVVNSSKVVVTGRKENQKIYYHHTGYPGGIRAKTLKTLREEKPNDIIWRAVKGMLPKNRLASEIMSKLHIYEGPEHPHQGQSPEDLKMD